MSNLLIGLIGAVLATNQPAAVSNLVEQTTGVSVEIPDPNDPVEKEFEKLEADDDAAHEEVDRWIRENQEFAKKDAAVSNEELNSRIRKRLDVIRKAYESFIQRHPNHVGARLAFASFLEGIGEEEASLAQMEKAREIDPKDPAPWNNLANYYGHYGEVTNAFAYYAKAISLNPNEPVYYHNFGTTVYLFRKDAREFYHINEQQVFDKAMNLYSNSMRLDPTNFWLATDVAQSYYGIKPMRTNDALVAWTNALNVARTEEEREGIYLHLARVKMMIGQFDEAQTHLNSVTNSSYDELKERLIRSLHEREGKTNSTAVNAATNSASLPSSAAQTNVLPEKPPATK
ncbi:MAG TPA: hypothetical protein VIV82_06680 [Verrucomicrobiae bacterium]